MIRIGFGFQARVGKDTATDFLVFKYGGTKVAFADPLKEIRDFAQQILGAPTVKDRALLQFLGDWARSHDPDVFVNTAAREIPKDSNAYVSDVRFKSEFDYLKSQGFLLVRIKRRGATASSTSESECAHESEHGLHGAPWDYTIKNYGSRDEFFDQLCNLVKHHFPHAAIIKTYGRCVCCSTKNDEQEEEE